MFATPVILRELQLTGRDAALYRHRTIVAALVIFVAGLGISFSSSTPGLRGRSLFLVFAWAAFFLALLEAARSGADAISGERREGTLGLLFLTDLRARDVVFGKLVFVGIRSFVFLLPMLPVFAVPLLLGGVSGAETLRVMLALVMTLIFALSTGLFASSTSVTSTAALGKAVLILLLITIQPCFKLISGAPLWPFSAHWIAGPLAMMNSCSDVKFGADAASFWLAALVSVVASVLLLAGAAHFTERDISKAPITSKSRWWQRVLQPRRGYVAPRGETSDQSPAVWLAERTLPGQQMLWTLIGIGLATCFTAGLFGSILVAVALQVFFGILLKFWIAVVSPQSLHELLKSGALELILCTPLQPRSIVRGQADLLYESFIGPALTIAVGFPIALYGGSSLAQRQSAEPAMMVPAGILWLIYTFLDLHALGYLGMWHGLSSSRIEAAVGKTSWYGLVLPWLFIVVPVLGWVALLFWPVIVIAWATKRLNERFHQCVIDR